MRTLKGTFSLDAAYVIIDSLEMTYVLKLSATIFTVSSPAPGAVNIVAESSGHSKPSVRAR